MGWEMNLGMLDVRNYVFVREVAAVGCDYRFGLEFMKEDATAANKSSDESACSEEQPAVRTFARPIIIHSL